jgi:hypothetical protein
MRVEEKDSDRKLEVHLHQQGKVQELEEFGQFVDPVDNAICCYVPVEEEMAIKLRGKFTGTVSTLLSYS